MLIADVELAEQRYQSEDERAERRQVQCCAVDLYGLLRTVTKRVGRLDLSLLVADRAAQAADDPHRLVAARWNLAHVLLANHQAEGAEAIAMQAAETLAPFVQAGDLGATALCGALTLLSALASVRQGQVWTARERVRAAVPLAERTGEHNVHWTAFGPTNVAMYAVSVEVEAGRRPGSVLGRRRQDCVVCFEVSYWLSQPDRVLRARIAHQWGLTRQPAAGVATAPGRDSTPGPASG